MSGLFSLKQLKTRSKSVQFRIILWFFLIGSVPSIGIGLFALGQQSVVLKKEAFSIQQMTATSQVLSALREIQTSIHQSSVSMKQTQTITSSLADTSQDLKRLMNEFKINGSA